MFAPQKNQRKSRPASCATNGTAIGMGLGVAVNNLRDDESQKQSE
jgi:hypothetical protein